MSEDLIAEYYSIQEALADELYDLEQLDLDTKVARRERLRELFEVNPVAKKNNPTKKAPVEVKSASKSVSNEDRVVAYLRNFPASSRETLRRVFKAQIQEAEMNRIIKRLRDRGTIIHAGTKKDGTWSLI